MWAVGQGHVEAVKMLTTKGGAATERNSPCLLTLSTFLLVFMAGN